MLEMSFFKGPPYRQHNDLEAGGSESNQEEESFSSSERLREREEEKQQLLRKVRVHVEGIGAANLFKVAGKERANVSGTLETSPSPPPSGKNQLAVLSRDHNVAALQECGGVEGLSYLLKTNLEKGIKGDNDDLLKRKYEFGSNTYPWEKGRSFWMFLWEAWQNPTLIILIVAAVTSLALDIKTEGIKEGWYDGGSIAFAVIFVIVVKAISDYIQSLQIQSLNEEKRNIHPQVIRSGRRIEISIYDIVVGDVVPLNIGDRIPANGVLITGHSLAIDESIMTRERKIVHKDSRDPILFSGFKVADGSGTMLVTSVGINADRGNHKANISEDTVEETPLQGRLNGLATLISKVEEYTVAVCVLIVLLVRYFTGNSKDANENVLFIAGTTKVGPAIDGAIQIVNVAVTIVLVAVPEGLPLAVPLTGVTNKTLSIWPQMRGRFCDPLGMPWGRSQLTTLSNDSNPMSLTQSAVH